MLNDFTAEMVSHKQISLP